MLTGFHIVLQPNIKKSVNLAYILDPDSGFNVKFEYDGISLSFETGAVIATFLAIKT